MKDMYKQDWNSSCENSPRCDTYTSFKQTFEMEKYIKDLNVNKFVYALARLRTGASELKINRMHTQPQPDMGCPFCNKVENELHFLKECPTYTHLRNKYLSPFYKHEQITNLDHFFNTEDRTTIRNLAQYVFHAMTLRKQEIAWLKSRNKYLLTHNQQDKQTQTDIHTDQDEIAT